MRKFEHMPTYSMNKYRYAGVCRGMHSFESLKGPEPEICLVKRAKFVDRAKGIEIFYDPVDEKINTISFSALRARVLRVRKKSFM